MTCRPSGAAKQLVPDLIIYQSGMSAAVGDSSYNGGRLADSTTAVAGGRAAVFFPKPGAACQFYFKAGPVNASGGQFAGLAFKLAAGSDFVPAATVRVGIQVATAAEPDGSAKVPLPSNQSIFSLVVLPNPPVAYNFLATHASVQRQTAHANSLVHPWLPCSAGRASQALLEGQSRRAGVAVGVRAAG